MRKEFSQIIEKLGASDDNFFFLTGDLGFNAFENLKDSFEERFINAGVAEQSMVSIAAGMASTGLNVWVYSIAPFLTLKTTEQIRNDLCHTNLPVKLVGNGSGYGYGIMGATHHILEDIAILSSFPNIKIYVPAFSSDVLEIVTIANKEKEPSYLRLGLAQSIDFTLPNYSGLRKLMEGTSATVVVLGPLVHNLLRSIKTLPKVSLDVWSLTEIPIPFTEDFFKSIEKTKKLVILEEHVKEGGVGEKILAELSRRRIPLKSLTHLYAKGYPSHLYGSQAFHLRESDLDEKGILNNLKQIL